MHFIDGLDRSVPAYHGYKMYLINTKQQTDQDIYPDTLVDAIMRATRFETSFIETYNEILSAATPHSAFGAQQQTEDRGKRVPSSWERARTTKTNLPAKTPRQNPTKTNQR